MLSINVTVTSTLNVSMNDTRPLASAVRVWLVFLFLCLRFGFCVGFFLFVVFFSKPVAPVVFQPAKASSDRSECVRVAVFVKVKLQLEAVPQNMLAATTASCT